jgi:hypothetical protein
MKVQIDPDGHVAMIHSGEFGIRAVVSRLAMVNSFEGAILVSSFVFHP